MEMMIGRLAIYFEFSLFYAFIYNNYSIVYTANHQFNLRSLPQKLDDLVGRPFSQLIAVNIVTRRE